VEFCPLEVRFRPILQGKVATCKQLSALGVNRTSISHQISENNIDLSTILAVVIVYSWNAVGLSFN